VALGAVAVALIADGFRQWAEHGPPDWQPVSVLGLLAVPLLTRYSITVSQDAQANTLGLTAAILFAGDFDGPSSIFPVWGLLILVSSVLFKGGLRYGLPRGTDEVVAGWALVTVASYVDVGLRPFDRAFAALGTYLAVLAFVFWARRRLSGQAEPARALDRRATALALAGVYFASVFIAALRRNYEDPNGAGRSAVVAVLGLALVLAALIGYSISQQLLRGVAVLSEAATGLPWPADENDALVARFAGRAVRAAEARIAARPGPPGTLSAPVDAVRYIVLRRMPGDRPFSDADRRVLGAVASMASVSRSVDLREAGLRLRSITDAMTGLWNYPMFIELAEQALHERADDEVLVMLFIDLDRFKQLNEELGHFDADQVLCEIARRLQDAAPPTAAVARFAGDEFALLLRGVERETLDAQVQALVAAATAPIAISGRLLTVHLSVGVGVCESPEDTVEEVMRVAEEHMRAAKRAGRAAVASRSEKDLVDTVLGEDRTRVVFQPIVDARSGALWGCEALVRATDPELGEVAPLTLVSSAARQEALDVLTARVGAAAMGAMESLRRVVPTPLRLTLNLEFEQFRLDNPVLDELAGMLGQHGGGLTLELSERSHGRWTSQHDLLAERLEARGITLAIDDFGAGYATFGLLGTWRWDLVKIDRSLATAHDDRARLLFANVVRTLRELGLTTVAEGIETPEQLTAAREAGASLVQGHLVSGPLEIDDLVAMVGPDGNGLGERLRPARAQP
jgi:diguanylate cyclase (GGDEF)-like protein